MIASNLTFLLYFSLLYICGLSFLYFSKARINNIENRIYKFLLVLNILGIVLQIGCDYVSVYYESLPTVFSNMILRLYLAYFIAWINTILDYLLALIFSQNRKVVWINIVFTILEAILVMLLPFDLFRDVTNKVYYTYGIAINVTFAISTVLLILMSILLIFNIKKLNKKKISPIFVFMFFGVVAAIIQQNNPSIIIIAPMETFICGLMYFTIENPDLKMLAEVSLAKEQAEKANHAKTDFLSSMSHEIRTPLNAIVGFSQALIEEDIPEDSKDEVEDIITASLNLLDIVNGILDISKIEANKLEIVNTEYSLNKVLDELTILTKARIGDKPIEFRTHFDKSIPPVLYGDYVRLKQIILNLLTNAAKYTKQGYIDFEVNTVAKGDVCRLIISVKDTGIGIKEKNLDKLFTKFERFDKEQNITIEGTGLGLAITKKLIELMNGRIVAQSVYGEGSKFTVSIDQRIVAKEKLEEQTVHVEEIDISGKHILVVDDNAINIKVATRLLKDYKVVVDSCESGQECIDKIMSGNTYDLILMDDMMPKMSGVETFAKLRELPNFHIPTIALTANAISGMKEKYLKDGFNDYLAKPIDKLELNRILEKFLTKEVENCDIMKIGCDTMKDVNYLKDNGIDVDKSLELFGDMETYNETMVDFFGAVAEKLDKIKKFKETSDMANYAIEVHSLKSDSKYLGFTKLADLSYQHEMASKENNIDFVYENYDTLMEEANHIVTIVSTYLGKQNNVVIEKKAPISDKKILVVDDSNIIRNLIQRMFDEELQVISANDGVEATQIIASTPIDTIYGLLLDLNMPKADGFAVLDWFKKYNLFAKIPVAIITGEDSKENVQRANTYPIVGVLSKPFNERDVKNIVNDMRNFK